MFTRIIFTIALLACSELIANEPESRELFDFSETKSGRQWRTVNDGVMGGRSVGQFKVAENGRMEFFGTLSLQNNGGFASVRSRVTKLDLQDGEAIVTRVRGDGRRYTLNLYVPRRRMAFSYRAEFQTKKDEWIEVRVPLEDFLATSFGRIVKNAGPVIPREINSVGFLLADKKAGPFKLEVDSIGCESKTPGDTEQTTVSD